MNEPSQLLSLQQQLLALRCITYGGTFAVDMETIYILFAYLLITYY